MLTCVDRFATLGKVRFSSPRHNAIDWNGNYTSHRWSSRCRQRNHHSLPRSQWLPPRDRETNWSPPRRTRPPVERWTVECASAAHWRPWQTNKILMDGRRRAPWVGRCATCRDMSMWRLSPRDHCSVHCTLHECPSLAPQRHLASWCVCYGLCVLINWNGILINRYCIELDFRETFVKQTEQTTSDGRLVGVSINN